MKPSPRLLTGALAGLLFTFTASGARAATSQDVLVQPPSIGQPQRGSLAGALAHVAYGPSQLARGAFGLPVPLAFPGERGPLLAGIAPSYSPEGGLGEWGHGWSNQLAIRRQRLVGDIDYASDELTSPWGRLERGTDGYYYPAGLGSAIRLSRAGDLWTAVTSSGTVYAFQPSDAVSTPDGIYAWHLSQVQTLAGDSTTLLWETNASGRKFLRRVLWGGRGDGNQYEATLQYETLAKSFVSYASGHRSVLDRRVKTVVVSARNGSGVYVERWRHELGYQTSPLGPAYYLRTAQRRFASGESEPATTYDYDLGAEQLAAATLTAQPALDAYLAANNGLALQPDRAAFTDLEQNGLTDLEHSQKFTLVRQTESGFVFEPLPAKTGAENGFCRPDDSDSNQARLLARMTPDIGEPHVVVVRKEDGGASSRIYVCNRVGTQLYTQAVSLNWELGANTRLADLDLDRRPDLIRVYAGGYQVLRNLATTTGVSFAAENARELSPPFTPQASWILDFNGDGKPDLLARHAGGTVVWLGRGHLQFEKDGTSFPFLNQDGTPFTGIASYRFTHGDFNRDGLSDVILSSGHTVFLFTNRGDAFVHAPVPGLVGIGWDFSLPVFGDLTASGNPEVVFAHGLNAHSIALATPSTGQMTRADDGKGTVLRFGYGRVRPVPGIIHRTSILRSLTVESTGYDAVTYDYEYEAPVWHTLGRFLVGFRSTRKAAPLLRERVEFYNDDHVSGLVEKTVDTDVRTPGIERFSSSVFEDATFAGLPWRRLREVARGWRRTDGADAVVERTRITAYERDRCPVDTVVETGHGALTSHVTLAHVDGIPDALQCLARTTRVTGTHDDHELDFDETLEVERNALGQVERVSQLGPDGPLVVQDPSYDGLHRLESIAAPGRGTSTFSYDPTGHLATTVSPDLVERRVTGRDPVTDAITALRVDRGAAWTQGFDHDGQERLFHAWDELSGTSASTPSTTLGYRFADAERPAMTRSRQLVDAASGAAVEAADLSAADGAALTSARLDSEGWVFSGLALTSRQQGETRSYWIPGSQELDALTVTDLAVTGSQLSTVRTSGFGELVDETRVIQSGVSGHRVSTRDIVHGELVTTAIENGSHLARTSRDAHGHALWFENQTGVVSEYRYDARGRLRRIESPDGTQRIDYDDYGRPRLAGRDDLAQVESRFAPVTGLLSERRYLRSDGSVERTEAFTYDAIGRLTEVKTQLAGGGAARVVRYGHDGEVGLPLPLPGQRGFVTHVSGPGFDRIAQYRADGKVTTTRNRIGQWVTLMQDTTYHVDGSLRTVRTRVENAAGAILLDTTRSHVYDGLGRLDHVAADGATLYTMVYGDDGLVDHVMLAGGARLDLRRDGATRARNGYRYRYGNRDFSSSWQRDVRGLVDQETTRMQENVTVRRYGYDPRGYLTSATDKLGTETYGYDASGLPTSVTDQKGARTIDRTGSTFSAGGQSYQVDLLGRVIRRGDLALTYGPSGQIEVALRGARRVEYRYDDAGQRVLKLVDGAPTLAFFGDIVFDGTRLIEPLQVAGQAVGVLENGVFRAGPYDARGTAYSSNPNARASAYGVRLEHDDALQVIDYALKGWDPDLEIVRMGVRDYDSLLAQFWTPDPLFLESLDRVLASPSEGNLYSYARNNPVSFTDPTGMSSEDDRMCDGDNFIGDVAFSMGVADSDNASTGAGEPAAPAAAPAAKPRDVTPTSDISYEGELKLFGGDEGFGIGYEGGLKDDRGMATIMNHEFQLGIFGPSAEFNIAKITAFDNENGSLEIKGGNIKLSPGEIEATLVAAELAIKAADNIKLKLEGAIGFATPFKGSGHGNMMELGIRSPGPFITGVSVEVAVPPVPTPDLAAHGTANVVARSGEGQFIYYLMQLTSIY